MGLYQFFKFYEYMKKVEKIRTFYWENGHKNYEFSSFDFSYHGLLKRWNEDGSIFHYRTYNNNQDQGVLLRFRY